LLKGTAVGLLIQAENYSNLPLWADEYRNGKVNDEKEAILRDAFNRVPTEKWSPDGVQRKSRTNFIVSGESTTTDAAMRSRYPHVQMSAGKRLKNHYEWMQAQKQNFFVFGRLLLERRAAYVALVMANLNQWLVLKQMAGVGERDKLVHGMVWAAWTAMSQLLESHASAEAQKFLEFMISHAETSAAVAASCPASQGGIASAGVRCRQRRAYNHDESGANGRGRGQVQAIRWTNWRVGWWVGCW
jgi:hypothetical protein